MRLTEQIRKNLPEYSTQNLKNKQKNYVTGYEELFLISLFEDQMIHALKKIIWRKWFFKTWIYTISIVLTVYLSIEPIVSWLTFWY